MSTLIATLISTLKQAILDEEPKFWVFFNHGYSQGYNCVCSTLTKLSGWESLYHRLYLHVYAYPFPYFYPQTSHCR